jgi:hypothetical protein
MCPFSGPPVYEPPMAALGHGRARNQLRGLCSQSVALLLSRQIVCLHPCGRRQKVTGPQWWPPSKVMIMVVVRLDDCTMPTPWAGLVKPR